MTTPDRPTWAMEAAELIVGRCASLLTDHGMTPRFSVRGEIADIMLAACPGTINAELLAALQLLVDDVAGYPAWERPCHALDKAVALLAKVKP